MKYKTYGNNLQVLVLQISMGEKVYGEAGSMVYMSGNMDMETQAKGGLMKGLKRKLSGESFFMTEFTPAGGTGIVAFGGNCPGTIKALKLDGNKQYMVQKDGFLCAEHTVDLDIGFQKKLGGAFFGGHGMILQKMTGKGHVFVHAAGDFIEKDLRQGEVLKVSTGHTLAWEDTVDFDIQRTVKVKSMLFSGEGMFVTTLRGPGKVWLQSMTLQQLASSLKPYLPKQQSSSSGKSGFSKGGSISFG
ncbi:MAG: TIGR00266 family protein [Candidatus Saliniplasma sp.]